MAGKWSLYLLVLVTLLSLQVLTTDGQRTRDRRQPVYPGCKECIVKGTSFNGHTRFQYDEGCLRYRCICWCNGTYDCPPQYTLKIRGNCSETSTTQEPPNLSTARSPDVTPAREPDTTQTSGRDDSRRTGSTDETNRDSSRTSDGGDSRTSGRRDDRRPSRCQTCTVGGIERIAKRYFEYKPDKCTNYRYCLCSCDGTWNCPARYAQNLCPDNAIVTTERPRESRTTSSPTTARCRSCNVNGRSFTGGKPFEITVGCLKYTNCFCRCDGSYSCPPTGAMNVCNPNKGSLPGGGEVSTGRSSCRGCYAYGKYFKSLKYFEVTDGCTRYRNCICRCDGSWNCNHRFAEDICTDDRTPGSGRNTGSGQCSKCRIGEKVVEPNSQFELEDGCIQYSNCLCRCDGSWVCPSHSARNTCNERTERPATCSNCVAKGKVVRPNTKFDLVSGCIYYTDCDCNCDGSWECYGNQARDICRNDRRQPSSRCRTCKARDGRRHPANSPFSFVEGCIEYNCDCSCNGSWNCPSDRSKWICKDQCRSCSVEGRTISNGTVFQYSTGCLEYTCNCFCNGSWSCPGRTVRNTCPPGVNNNCNKCRISSTEVYDGEEDFVLRQGCLHYQCRCNCDGSYECPGKEARNVCRGEVLGGCRSCVVSETDIFQGDSDFRLRRDCLHYECYCNCDGSWICPPEKARDLCIGEVPGGCRVCKVDGQVFRSNSSFPLRRGCIHYKCRCDCDGGWNCPGEDARDVCKLEVPGGCRSCILSKEEFYAAYRNFDLTRDCIKYKCYCNCDGSYTCPGRTARRVCGHAPKTEDETCSLCTVSDTEKFNGNTTFYLERKCFRFQCKCKCDGTWECPARDSEYICTIRDSSTIAQDRSCRPCSIGVNMYPGNSTFKFSRRCYQYNCNCDCNGRWSCDHRNPTNLCDLRREQLRALTGDSSAFSPKEDFSASRPDGSYKVEEGNALDETDIRSTTDSSNTDVDDSRPAKGEKGSVTVKVDGMPIPDNNAEKGDGTDAPDTAMEKGEKGSITEKGDGTDVPDTATGKGEKGGVTERGEGTDVPDTATEKGEKGSVPEKGDRTDVPDTAVEKGEKGSVTEKGDGTDVPETATEKGEKGSVTEKGDGTEVPDSATEKGEKGSVTEKGDGTDVPDTAMEKGEKGSVTEKGDGTDVPDTAMEKGEKGSVTEKGDGTDVPDTAMEKGEKGSVTDKGDGTDIPDTTTEKGEKGSITEKGEGMDVPDTTSEKGEKGSVTEKGDGMDVPDTTTEKDEKGSVTEKGDGMDVPGTTTEKGEKGSVTDKGDGMDVPDTMTEKGEKGSVTEKGDGMDVPDTMTEKGEKGSLTEKGDGMDVPDTTIEKGEKGSVTEKGDGMDVPDTTTEKGEKGSVTEKGDGMDVPDITTEKGEKGSVTGKGEGMEVPDTTTEKDEKGSGTEKGDGMDVPDTTTEKGEKGSVTEKGDGMDVPDTMAEKGEKGSVTEKGDGMDVPDTATEKGGKESMTEKGDSVDLPDIMTEKGEKGSVSEKGDNVDIIVDSKGDMAEMKGTLPAENQGSEKGATPDAKGDRGSVNVYTIPNPRFDRRNDKIKKIVSKGEKGSVTEKGDGTDVTDTTTEKGEKGSVSQKGDSMDVPDTMAEKGEKGSATEKGDDVDVPDIVTIKGAIVDSKGDMAEMKGTLPAENQGSDKGATPDAKGDKGSVNVYTIPNPRFDRRDDKITKIVSKGEKGSVTEKGDGTDVTDTTTEKGEKGSVSQKGDSMDVPDTMAEKGEKGSATEKGDDVDVPDTATEKGEKGSVTEKGDGTDVPDTATTKGAKGDMSETKGSLPDESPGSDKVSKNAVIKGSVTSAGNPGPKRGRLNKGKRKGKKCKACIVGPKKIPTGAKFRYKTRCKHFTHCRCSCFGTWKCRVVKNVCEDGSNVQSDDSFVSGPDARSDDRYWTLPYDIEDEKSLL